MFGFRLSRVFDCFAVVMVVARVFDIFCSHSLYGRFFFSLALCHCVVLCFLLHRSQIHFALFTHSDFHIYMGFVLWRLRCAHAGDTHAAKNQTFSTHTHAPVENGS